MRFAFITGINGQDGSYLAEFLLEKDYKVFGTLRRTSWISTQRIDHLFHHPNLKLIYGDVLDGTNLIQVFNTIKNENFERLEVYNLAAQSHVKISFDLPEYTGEVDALGTLRLLEAIRLHLPLEKVRFYQASSSELFGLVQEIPQKETTPFYPRSPYGVAKLYAFWITKNYRESYGMFASNGILYNHESPRRGHNFVTRKITLGLGKIVRGESDQLVMGNLDSLRDWGHAKDYIEGMWQILQHSIPDDFILANEEMHSVREFIQVAFSLRGFDIVWEGHGENEKGVDRKSGKVLITVSPKYFRPAEVDQLLGDATKAKTILDWKPKISFKELVQEMVDHDCPLINKK